MNETPKFWKHSKNPYHFLALKVQGDLPPNSQLKTPRGHVLGSKGEPGRGVAISLATLSLSLGKSDGFSHLWGMPPLLIINEQHSWKSLGLCNRSIWPTSKTKKKDFKIPVINLLERIEKSKQGKNGEFPQKIWIYKLSQSSILKPKIRHMRCRTQKIGWWVVREDDSISELEIRSVWNTHVLTEKNWKKNS